ncbi:MAG: SCO family protein [Candidatus Accumulibacter sp.]|jgi:protein SCO1/2|uniref:SCO family protein n=1 Tax=Accumulibacter sp. TaxID=2053492 RepID=UPI00258673F4|nr:SCO family protein [Accumulibacter sp.]MBK8113999.1 SCO family protein [Accumulibacter sp.]
MKILSTLIVCITLLFAGCSQPPTFKSTDISGSDWGKDFALTDPQGQARRLADFKGKAVVVFFGYTQCPDVCPTTLLSMREVLNRLGNDAGRVQVIFVTLDPARDTPQVLREYVTAFHPSFVGLRGDEATTAAVARDFKVFYAKQAGSTAGTYSLDHSTGSYAYDPEGRLRLLIRHGETPDNVASDLRQLLAGK